jgi:RNA polymerase sigma-70 factor (ECF subfamily)
LTSDRNLLERAKRCDEAALGELYDQYAPRIYAYVYRRVQDAHLAEDLTGDVFVRVLQAIQSERFWETSFPGWLYRIAHNLVVDYYRRQPAVNDLMLDEQLAMVKDDPALMVARRLSDRQLAVALRHLTPEQQEVLALRFGEGMSAREVAEVTERTVGAIEALQHRGLASLRRMMDKEWDE